MRGQREWPLCHEGGHRLGLQDRAEEAVEVLVGLHQESHQVPGQLHAGVVGPGLVVADRLVQRQTEQEVGRRC